MAKTKTKEKRIIPHLMDFDDYAAAQKRRGELEEQLKEIKRSAMSGSVPTAGDIQNLQSELDAIELVGGDAGNVQKEVEEKREAIEARKKLHFNKQTVNKAIELQEKKLMDIYESYTPGIAKAANEKQQELINRIAAALDELMAAVYENRKLIEASVQPHPKDPQGRRITGFKDNVEFTDYWSLKEDVRSWKKQVRDSGKYKVE